MSFFGNPTDPQVLDALEKLQNHSSDASLEDVTVLLAVIADKLGQITELLSVGTSNFRTKRKL